MKVIAFNGSARKNGNTAIMLNRALASIAAKGIETELVQLSGKRIWGCLACMKCFDTKDQTCIVAEDIANECIAKMLEADGILLGSPVYFANMSTELKALIDRAGMVARANKDMFQRKVGAAVAVARRAGAVHTFDSINHFFFISQMVVCGSSYWNIGYGREKGEVESDAEGLATMDTLGSNMAWALSRLHG